MQPYLVAPANGSDPADEWVRLGIEAQMAGQLPLAQQRFQQALRLDPRHALATQNLAIVFASSNLLNEALLTIERAAMFDPAHAAVRMNWALMALESDRIDEALEQARKALSLAPKDVGGNPARMTLAMVLGTAGLAAEAIPLYNEILDTEPAHPAAGPNACFVQTLTTATPADLLRQRKRWYDAHAFKGEKKPHDNDRLGAPCPGCRPYPGTMGANVITKDTPVCEKCKGTGFVHRVLRVGYVGGDFKQHSASFIFSRVLLHHTPAVEMYLYSSLPVDPEKDGRTKAFQTACGGRWRDISAMSDEDADKLIRKDRIDILVDLAGHTNGGRLALFTRKPAPVQVTAWGFAHGSGCPEIDYFFADPVAVPEAERKDYAERIWDLPCIVTMEPPNEYNLKGTSNPPLRKNGYVTFGSYARYEKMSDTCLKTFAEILRRVPDSRLELKDNAYRRPYAIRRTMSLMPDIAPERLLFSLATSHPDHLLAYQQADLCLDPWPHGGGVVGLEQLYMGVPVLTLYGTQPAGRSTSSILTAMGRQDWVCKTPEQFIEAAVDAAEHPKELAEARKTLRDELLASPVVKDYHLAVEKAYAEMWRIHCEK